MKAKVRARTIKNGSSTRKEEYEDPSDLFAVGFGVFVRYCCSYGHIIF
jgi:hypothetical protein